MSHPQRLTILGSTGSIGASTLRVVAEHPDRFRIFALTAHGNDSVLFSQCLAFCPEYVVLVQEDAALRLRQQLRQAGVSTEVLTGAEALSWVASAPEVDCVMAAIVGGVGLLPSLAAAQAGKKLLLANKEALVMAGHLFMNTVRTAGATLLPIDSEHNAIFQCLPMSPQGRFNHEGGQGFQKMVLTASGGPFLHTPLEDMRRVSPAQACAHPNWKMGRKISVDSATMLNKSLELIEATALFEVPVERVEVVIHPQSIIHSLVYYSDGSVLAQMGNPDMRTPIAHALAWPERIHSGVEALDLVAMGRLEFLAPDETRFPCLALGRQAAVAKGSSPIVLNAANEVAVEAFLQEEVGFTEIPAIIAATLDALPWRSVDSLDAVLDIDAEARSTAKGVITREWRGVLMPG